MTPSDNQRFPKAVRIRRQKDFDAVHQSNAFAADEVLVVKACPNEWGITRLGLSVSRRVGNAVVRNRWKRLIREAFRIQKNEMPVGLDLVYRPRKGAKCQWNAIFHSVKRLAERVEKKL